MDLVEIGYRIKAEGLIKANKELDDLLQKSKLADTSTKTLTKTQKQSANAQVSAADKTKAAKDKLNKSLQSQAAVLRGIQPLLEKGLTLSQAKLLSSAKLNKAGNIYIANLENQYQKMNKVAQEAANIVRANRDIANASKKVEKALKDQTSMLNFAHSAALKYGDKLVSQKNKMDSLHASAVIMNNDLDRQKLALSKVSVEYTKADSHIYAFKKATEKASAAIKAEEERMESLQLTAYKMNATYDRMKAAKTAAFATKVQNDIRKETFLLEYLKEGYTRATAAKLASAKVSGVNPRELALLAVARKATDEYTKAQAKLRLSTSGTTDIISNMMFSFKAAIILQAALTLVKVADTMDLLRSRARLVTPVTESVGEAMQNIVDVSMKTRASLTDTTTLYNRLTPALSRYGIGTKDVMKVVEGFNSSLLISGATARETSSAILQFSQSMAAGKLAGDEFRSVTEAAPELLNAIAEGSGYARDKLKDMSRNGLLTTKFVAEALIVQLDNLKKKAGEIPVNIGQALTALKTSVSYVISVVNNSTGATGKLAKSIFDVSMSVKEFGTALNNGDYDKQIESIKNLTKFVFNLSAGYLGFKVVAGLYSKATSIVIASNTAATASFGTLKASIASVFSLAAAGFVGYQIGTYLKDEFEIVEKAGIVMASLITKYFINLGGVAKTIGAEIEYAFTHPFDAILNKIAEFLKLTSSIPNKITKAFGIDFVSDINDSLISKVVPVSAIEHKKALADIKANTKQAVKDAEDSYTDLFASVGKASKKLKDEMGKAPLVQQNNITPFQEETEKLKAFIELAKTANKEGQINFLKKGTDLGNTGATLAEAKERIEVLKEESRIRSELNSNEDFERAVKLNEFLVQGVPLAMAELQVKREMGEISNVELENRMKILKMTEDQAIVADILKRANEDAINPFKEMADLDLSSVFGDIGNPFEQAFQGISDLADATNTYNKDKAAAGKNTIALAKVEKDYTKAQLKGTADILKASKGFFKEKSKGYELMEAGEKSFRLLEFAMSAKSIIVSAYETAAKVGNFLVQSVAAGNTALATSLTLAPPASYAAFAATAALLAGIGVSVGGGGGSGGESTSGKQQRTQGTGNVLGDANAKSESLVKALETMEDNTLDIVKINVGMLGELRSLNANLNGLGNVLLRTTDIGGNLTGVNNSFNLGQSGSDFYTGDTIDKIVNDITFGGFESLAGSISSKKTSKINEGIELTAASVSSIISNGIVDVFAFADTRTKKKKWGNVKTSYGKITKDLSTEIEMQFGAVLSDIFTSVFAAVDVLGMGDKSKVAFEGLSISTMGLSPEDSVKEIQAVLSNFADETAKNVLPILNELQQVGEGTFETLARVTAQTSMFKDVTDILGISLTRETSTVENFFQSIGSSLFGAIDSIRGRNRTRTNAGVKDLTGEEIVRIADDLANAAGGVAQFQENISSFLDFILTDAEKLGLTGKSIGELFESLSLSLPNSKESLKELVSGLDLTTKAGQEAFTSLTASSDALSDYFDAIEEQAERAYDFDTSLGLADGFNPLRKALQEVGKDFDSVKKIAEETGLVGLQEVFKSLTQVQKSALEPFIDDIIAMGNAVEETSKSVTAFQNVSSTIQAYLDKLKVSSESGSPLSRANEGLSQFRELTQKALGGDADAAAKLTSSASTLITLSKDAFASGSTFQSIYAEIVGALEQVADLSDVASIEELQYNVLLKQLEQLEALNGGILGLGGSLTVELTTTAKSNIEKLIKFVLDTDDFPAEMKDIVLNNIDDLLKIVNFAQGAELPSDLTSIILNNVDDLIKLTNFVVGSDLNQDLKDLIFNEVDDLTKKTNLVIGSDLTNENKNIVLNNINDLIKKVNFNVTSDLSPDQKALALLESSNLLKTVDFAKGAFNPQAVELLSETDSNIIKTIYAFGGNLTPEQKAILDAINGQTNVGVSGNVVMKADGKMLEGLFWWNSKNLVTSSLGAMVGILSDIAAYTRQSAYTGLETFLRDYFNQGYGDVYASPQTVKNRSDAISGRASDAGRGLERLFPNLQNATGSLYEPTSVIQGVADLYDQLNVTPSAKGNAFNSGSVTAFANGGAFTNSIVNTPTMSPMALFGEAGPEAIMPLSRGSDGTLGVRLMGGGLDTSSIVSEIAESNKTLTALVRLQQAANKRIIERLDSLDERLETVETKTRLKDSA